MDYSLENGTVFNPSSGKMEKKNVYLHDGRIDFPGTASASPDAERINLEGCFIVPGLIDTHIHANMLNDSLGANADILCIPNGVTTAIDAGSCGIFNIRGLISGRIPFYTTNLKALVNVVPCGQLFGTPYEEVADPDTFDGNAILQLFRQNPKLLKGLKLRCHKNCTRGFGLQPLRKTIEIADLVEAQGYHCPVVVHLGALESPFKIGELLELLRPGDVMAHVFQGSGETILDNTGRIQLCFWKARERGVLFDFAHGKYNFTFHNMKQAFQEGFYPDMLGTDIWRGTQYIRPAFSIMSTMTLVYALGMPFEKILSALTCIPNQAYALEANEGLWSKETAANLSVFRLSKHRVVFQDKAGEQLSAEECFVPLLTVKDGTMVYRQSFI